MSKSITNESDGNSVDHYGEEKSKYRDIGISELMKEYKPMYFARLGFLASMFGSAGLPLFGLLFAKLVFTLAIDPVNDLEEFKSARNLWCGLMSLHCIGIGLSAFF
eukprot:CAMPEP_0176396728 /NCGR_PEP_ID=MMETSP0126-20121128/44506_1 /TAXON_ID=141414 ORGANISM="Strombidinopsis acuminatum, Strain SPMC142" /NCGR_SAMPLE_ID=MMETSP0126 /ASSEMBLY_ACC=CAM_ASM_000229 /LENGTH=105 /DNA_ID=CAMNT_0017770511 /DNA_START=1242 /DNA_END=1559 /DNA_ORIENTATION=-